MLNGEQRPGETPAGSGGRSLRKVRAGLGWSCEGPVREFFRAWMRCLAFQQIREAGVSLAEVC